MAAEDAAVVVSLRANLKDYEAALKSAVRATERAATAAEKTLSNVGKKAGAGQGIAESFAKSSSQIQNDARVLQFQLNDIFSGLASGQGIRALQVQLGQIAQQMSGGSLAQGARTMGAAMLGMVNPINLAVVAFGVLASVAASYFTSAEDDAAEATKELEKQADALDKLADKYGHLFPELKRAADELRNQADAAGRAAALQKALAAAYEDTGTAIDDMLGNVFKLQGLLTELGVDPAAANELLTAFEKLDAAVEDNNARLKDAQPLLKALNGIIENSSGLVRDLATQIRDQLVQSFGELERAAESAGKAIQNSLNFQMPGAGGPLDLGPITGQNRIDLLNKSLGDAAGAIDSFVERVIQAESGGDPNAKNPLSSATGAGQFIKSTWLSVFKRNFAAEAKGMSDAAILALRTDLEVSRRVIRAYATENARDLRDAGLEVTEQTLQLAHFLGAGGAKAILRAAPGTRAADVLGADQVAANRSILGGGATREDVLAYAARRAGAATGGKAKETPEQKFAEDLAASARATKELNAELQVLAESGGIVQDFGYKTEFAKKQQELLNKAEAEGVAITPELTAQINQAADAHARASAAIRLQTEAAQASANRMREQAQAAAQFSQQISQMAQSAIGGLVNDLRNGVDAGEAFNNMLNRILDSLIQMSLQAAFGQGGLGGIIGGLFGGATAPAAAMGGIVGKTSFPRQRVDPRVFIGAPSMASGGMISGGGVPIIAHPGEMIIPRNMVGRGVGGTTNINNSNMRMSIDMGTDTVATSPESAKAFSNNIRRMVQVEMVRESRPGGLLRRV